MTRSDSTIRRCRSTGASCCTVTRISCLPRVRGRNRSTSILRGLPGSGKSTWAQNWASDPANTWLHCVISLDAGWDVVADAQHANPEYANELARLATRHGAIWRTEDFDVPLDELLRRNEARPRADHVPEEYIRSSWKRFHHVMFRPLNPENPNGDLLKRMIADPYVRVTPVRGESDVFACNFTREAFLEGRWNTRTINARGLFVDKNETVVQRGSRSSSPWTRPNRRSMTRWSRTATHPRDRSPCAWSARRTAST